MENKLKDQKIANSEYQNFAESCHRGKKDKKDKEEKKDGKASGIALKPSEVNGAMDETIRGTNPEDLNHWCRKHEC